MILKVSIYKLLKKREKLIEIRELEKENKYKLELINKIRNVLIK